MTVSPNHTFSTFASLSRVNIAETVRRSSFGFNEQRSVERICGSIGMVRSTRYTLVARSRASVSSALPGFTKNETSAMWTPTSNFPSESCRTERASSKSLASKGSMVQVLTFRKSACGLRAIRAVTSVLNNARPFSSSCFASLMTPGGNSGENPCPKASARISVSCTPALPITSSIVPSG